MLRRYVMLLVRVIREIIRFPLAVALENLRPQRFPMALPDRLLTAVGRELPIEKFVLRLLAGVQKCRQETHTVDILRWFNAGRGAKGGEQVPSGARQIGRPSRRDFARPADN